MNKEYYKLRILMQLIDQQDTIVSVTALSKMLSLGKTYISKMMHELEDEGLVDMSDNRRPDLTDMGRDRAMVYSTKVQINLSRLLGEGVSPKEAMNDACVMALCCSDATNHLSWEIYRLHRAKQLIRERESLTGDDLCRLLDDGQYSVFFIMYKTRERDRSESVLSMANNGFEQPCLLSVKNGTGTFALKGVELSSNSKATGAKMTGRPSSVKYQDMYKYFPCEHIGDMFMFPASAVRFHKLESEGRQVLHGFIRLSVKVDVGAINMPQSTALCTFII